MSVPTISELGVRGLAWVVGSAATLAVAWLSWLTAAQSTHERALQQRPTREQTEQIVTATSPYNADRKLILQHMSDRAKVEERLLDGLEKQSDTLRRLESEVAKVGALLRQNVTQFDNEDF